MPKPPVPRSGRASKPAKSVSPQPRAMDDRERKDLDKSNYVDQRELQYENDIVSKKRFFSKE